MTVKWTTTPAYSPESNGMAEAFVNTFKRDYVAGGDLSDAETVIRRLPGWFEDYNQNAPHSALGMLSPREFLERERQTSGVQSNWGGNQCGRGRHQPLLRRVRCVRRRGRLERHHREVVI